MDAATELDPDELFFQQGENGSYVGGPTQPPSLVPVELELEAAADDSERLARAGRFRRPVALLVSSLGVLFLLTLATHRPAADGYADATRLSSAAASEVAPVAVAALEAPPAEPFIASPLTPLPAQSAIVIATEPIAAEPVATEPIASAPVAVEAAPAAQRPSSSNRSSTSRASTLKQKPATSVTSPPSPMTLKSAVNAPPSAVQRPQQTPSVVPAARFPDFKPQ